jgi:hypothetical protein
MGQTVAGNEVRVIKLLAAAIAIEAVLAVLAVFGGPHGALGGWPWMLQLPGILVVLLVPGEGGFAWRATTMILVQIGIWYAICALVAHRVRLSRAGRQLP